MTGRPVTVGRRLVEEALAKAPYTPRQLAEATGLTIDQVRQAIGGMRDSRSEFVVNVLRERDFGSPTAMEPRADATTTVQLALKSRSPLEMAWSGASL